MYLLAILVILLQVYFIVGAGFAFTFLIRSKSYGWKSLTGVLHWIFLWPTAFR